MVLRLKTRESRSLPGLPRGEASISSLLHANKAAALQSAGLVLREPPAPHHCPTATPGPISPPMARAPKDTTPRPRPSRGKSGKPPAPPVEGLAGTPQTKRSAKAMGGPPQAPFLPPLPSDGATVSARAQEALVAAAPGVAEPDAPLPAPVAKSTLPA